MAQENEKTQKVIFPSGATRSVDAEHLGYAGLSPFALRRYAARHALGASIHGENNFRLGMPFSTLLNHAERHLQLYKIRQFALAHNLSQEDVMLTDREWEEDHLAAAFWGIGSLMEQEITKPEENDLFRIPFKGKIEEDPGEGLPGLVFGRIKK